MDEFLFDHDDFLILEHNVCIEDGIKDADFGKNGDGHEHKSDLLHGSDSEQRLREIVDLDPHPIVEHIYQVGKGETPKIQDSHGVTIDKYDIQSDFDIHHSSSSVSFNDHD